MSVQSKQNSLSSSIIHRDEVPTVNQRMWNLIANSKKGSIEMLQQLGELFQQGADPSAINPQINISPLYLAAETGVYSLVSLFLTSAKCNAIDAPCRAGGKTALIAACEGGHAEVVKILLQHGANVESKDADQMTPLLYAARGGHTEIVKEVLKSAKERDQWEIIYDAMELSGKTACHYASKQKEVKILQMLIDFDPLCLDVTDNDGHSPLHCAIKAGYQGHIELLIATASRLEIQEDFVNSPIKGKEQTPLHLAAFLNNPAVIETLIRNGAAVDLDDSRGNTPLFYAATSKNSQAVWALVKNGAITERQLSKSILFEECTFLDILSKSEAKTHQFFVDCFNYHQELIARLEKLDFDLVFKTITCLNNLIAAADLSGSKEKFKDHVDRAAGQVATLLSSPHLSSLFETEFLESEDLFDFEDKFEKLCRCYNSRYFSESAIAEFQRQQDSLRKRIESQKSLQFDMPYGFAGQRSS